MYIDYNQMTEIYNNINDIIKQLIDTINDSKNIVNKLNDNDCWDGKGYDHYQELYSNLCTNFVAFCDYMYVANTNIKDSIVRYQEVDAKISGGGGITF